MCERILVPPQKIFAQGEGELEYVYKYIFDHHYDDVWLINENQSITYYTNDERNCLVGTCNFYKGYDVFDISGNSDIKGMYNPRALEKKYHMTTYEKIDYNLFKKQIVFLIEVYGEYGDSILSIEKYESGGYVIEWRIERDPE